jgi:hypothetical protein
MNSIIDSTRCYDRRVEPRIYIADLPDFEPFLIVVIVGQSIGTLIDILVGIAGKLELLVGYADDLLVWCLFRPDLGHLGHGLKVKLLWLMHRVRCSSDRLIVWSSVDYVTEALGGLVGEGDMSGIGDQDTNLKRGPFSNVGYD